MSGFGVLFVCTGNICRSPTAEAVFRQQAEAKGWSEKLFTDSAGTHGYHVGDAPDPRTITAAAAQGYDLTMLRARKVTADDFDQFDLVAAMDRSHLAILEPLKPANCRARLCLFTDFIENAAMPDVPDPYYGGEKGFQTVLTMVQEGVAGILTEIETKSLS